MGIRLHHARRCTDVTESKLSSLCTWNVTNKVTEGKKTQTLIQEKLPIFFLHTYDFIKNGQ